MGVELDLYLLIGARIDMLPVSSRPSMERIEEINRQWLDELDADTHNTKGITVLYDGMNGQYMFIGQVLTKSGADQGMVPFEIIIGTPWDRYAIAQKIESLFGIKLNYIDIRPYFIPHYH